MFQLTIPWVMLAAFASSSPAGQTRAREGVRSEMLVQTAWLAAHVNDPKTVLLHVYWEHLLVSLDEPVLRTPAELRALFAKAGARPGTPAIAYCDAGMQATFNYFVARYLGLDARLYDGSFNEWRGQKKEPVVRGDARR